MQCKPSKANHRRHFNLNIFIFDFDGAISPVFSFLCFSSDWCGHPTTAVLALFKIPSLRKFVVIMRPKRAVLNLGSERRILTSYPDEAVKIELVDGKAYSTDERLLLKVRIIAFSLL